MPNPQERPSLHDIVDHAFFTYGSFLDTYPSPCRTSSPTSDTSLPSSHRRISLTCDRRANLTGRSSQPQRVTSSPAPSVSASSLAQQEREFWKAVEPGTPISTLLSSACQLLMAAKKKDAIKSLGNK
ncbi:hypothetical protein EDB85DRAFT_2236249 [Lactarius pseudohatsudake]|nr:hypothetical protein EDB85DRAFT_2236249 [Lactarius pseudohatsudake]